ncbi:MAG: hypothetical protein KDA65_18095 [Planctomycetaceae bacterium]|nr:hypothetical protein [Planctomycetaceae bacterium]
MKIETDRLTGLSTEQRERFLEVMHAIGERTIDTIQRGENRLFTVTVFEGEIEAGIETVYQDDNSQEMFPLTEWSTDYVRQVKERG